MAKPKNLLPASLMEKPKTFEEFQEFFFYWEPNMPFTDHSEGGDESLGTGYAKRDVKEFKLILWNAKKIKKLTKSEIYRIYSLYQGNNCFDTTASQGAGLDYFYHSLPVNKMKEEGCIKFKGWKDSDNPKDPVIKKLGPDAYNSPPDWLR